MSISDFNGVFRAELPIGVFDSGIGGISVLRELVKQLPQERFIYRGDCRNAPYGVRPVEEIRALTLENAQELYRMGMKCLVVACNTATSAAIKDLRKSYTDIPVIGIEPALKPAALLKEHAKVIVMATPGTVGGEKFHTLMHNYDKNADITAIGCPGLVEFVEEGERAGERVEEAIRELLLPVFASHGRPDAIVLGCTHYPFLYESIRKVAGETPVILDGSAGTARQTKRCLKKENLLREEREGLTASENGRTSEPAAVLKRVRFSFTLPGREALACRLLTE